MREIDRTSLLSNSMSLRANVLSCRTKSRYAFLSIKQILQGSKRLARRLMGGVLRKGMFFDDLPASGLVHDQSLFSIGRAGQVHLASTQLYKPIVRWPS